MKIFEANDKLANILYSNGFIDATCDRDKLKGKRAFKISKNSRKEVFFDYINIQVNNSGFIYDSRTELTEEELKLLFLYFRLSASDYKSIDESGEFNFNNAKIRLLCLEKELLFLNKYNIKNLRKNKLTRILDTFRRMN